MADMHIGRFTVHRISGGSRTLGPRLASYLSELPQSQRVVSVIPVAFLPNETTDLEVLTERVDGLKAGE